MKNYVRANPGAPFIVAFMLLLMSAASLLASTKPNEANTIANYAFDSLVIGIALQIGVVVQEEKRHSRRRNDNPSDSS